MEFICTEKENILALRTVSLLYLLSSYNPSLPPYPAQLFTIILHLPAQVHLSTWNRTDLL